MMKSERAGINRMIIVLAAGGTVLLLSGCQSSKPEIALKSSSKEYFSEAAYGVKASPRVADASEKMPRREGRYQLGKPYKVKDHWYRPKLNPDYKKVGAASWYGSAFHGRLTANGEVYDMTRLTAAHPTMPLPSYARVTNLEDGSSIIVRVNDRGPFEKGRVIDLSKRAAQMLDYQSTGVAKVEVDYVGPAPLDTHDDEYLVASYRPGGKAPDPSDGLPTGVMVAMNRPTPSQSAGSSSVAFASQPGLQAASQANAASQIALPAVGPILPDRPESLPDGNQRLDAGQLLSYAEHDGHAATNAFASILNAPKFSAAAGTPTVPHGDYIALGTWNAKADAMNEAHRLGEMGKVTIEASRGEGRVVYSLNLYPDGRHAIDDMLVEAWDAGAGDAFVVRD